MMSYSQFTLSPPDLSRYPTMHQWHGSILLPGFTVSGSPAEVFGANDCSVSLTQCRAGIELPGNRSICQIQQVPNENQPTRSMMVPGQKKPALPVATSPLDTAHSSLLRTTPSTDGNANKAVFTWFLRTAPIQPDMSGRHWEEFLCSWHFHIEVRDSLLSSSPLTRSGCWGWRPCPWPCWPPTERWLHFSVQTLWSAVWWSDQSGTACWCTGRELRPQDNCSEQPSLSARQRQDEEAKAKMAHVIRRSCWSRDVPTLVPFLVLVLVPF